jgi:hypothetical protein
MYDKDVAVIAEDLLLNASDCIGNNLERFGADNKAIDDIRTNENFRKLVAKEVADYPDEYEGISQEEAAEIVWAMYQRWAY